MRTLTAAAVAAALLAPATADAAPARPGCRPVLTDPKGDTHFGAVAEPGADITALTLRSDAKNLTIATTLADVDAPLVTAPLGRSVWVTFAAGEQSSFLAKWVQGVDKTYAKLSVADVDTGAGPGSGTVWQVKADLAWSVDVKTNQVRVTIPLKVLARYAGTARKGTQVRVRDVMTYDVEGLSEYHTGGTIDGTEWHTARPWALGDC